MDQHKRKWLNPNGLQALAAIAMAITTVVLVGVTWRYVTLTQQLLQAQIEPRAVLEFDLFTKEMVLGNGGVTRLVDVAVRTDIAVIAGPPKNALLMSMTTRPEIPDRRGSGWWDVQSLEPGKTLRKSIADVGDNALSMLEMAEKQHAENMLAGFAASEKAQIFCVLIFRLSFHREVDQRRYRETRTVVVFHDSKDPKRPAYWDPDIGGRSGLYGKVLEQVPPQTR